MNIMQHFYYVERRFSKQIKYRRDIIIAQQLQVPSLENGSALPAVSAIVLITCTL